jgi:hypothetical protein
LQERLEHIKGKNVFLWYHDGGWSHIRTFCLAYAARSNRVWIGNPMINDFDFSVFPEGQPVPHPDDLSDGLVVLTGDGCPIQPSSLSGARLLWFNRSYKLWDTEGCRFATIIGVRNQNSVEGSKAGMFFWMGKGTTIVTVYATNPGVVLLSADFSPGPSLPSSNQRTVLVQNEAVGHRQTVTITGGGQVLEVPVVAGANRVLLTPLDVPTLTRLPSGDDRPLLVGVGGLTAQWQQAGLSRPGEPH